MLRRSHAMLVALFVVFNLAACGVVNAPTGALPASPTPMAPTRPISSASPTPPTHATAPPAPVIPPTSGGVSGMATVGPRLTAGIELTPTPLNGPVTITVKDNQQTLDLTVGDSFTLDLGAALTWDVQVGDQQIIARVPDPNATDGAPQRYKALAPGRTELRATGDPRCRHLQPACMMPSILFRLTVIVK